jgi:hypothetical protein
MFYKFDTIKHFKNFEKYDVWYVIFQKKYGTVWYTVWCEFFENSRESLSYNNSWELKKRTEFEFITQTQNSESYLVLSFNFQESNSFLVSIRLKFKTQTQFF